MEAAEIKELKIKLRLAEAVIEAAECPYWGLGPHDTPKKQKQCSYCKARAAWDSYVVTGGGSG